MEEFIQQTPAKHHPAFSPGLEAELRNLDAAPAKELECERGKQILVTRYGDEQAQSSSDVGSQSELTSLLSTSSSLIQARGRLSLDRGIGCERGVLLP